jgi:excisionase family DNA binding protein
MTNEATERTLEQAAKLLGKSEKTIRRMLQDGSLTGHKVSGPRGEEWRIKPVAVSEDNHLCQALHEKDSRIEELVKQVGDLESTLSERDQELKRFTDNLDQANERLKAAEQSRDMDRREVSELKAQVQALTTQVSKLTDKLAQNLVQQPTVNVTPDSNIPATDVQQLQEPVRPEGTCTVKLLLNVKAKTPMHCPIGNPMQSRENIEKTILTRFNAKQLWNKQEPWKSTGEYELTLPHDSDTDLDRKVAELSKLCDQEATKLKCTVMCIVKTKSDQ